MQLSFGSGALFGERTDLTIQNAGVSTGGNGAIQFGVLQDASTSFEWTPKPLYGQYQFPVAVARAEGKITINAKFARINSKIYYDLMYGTAAIATAGQITTSYDEIQTSAATVTVTNAATFYDDLGVFYFQNYGAKNGNALQRVASAPAVGQYSVDYATGVYSFNAADVVAGPPAGTFYISYNYTVASTGEKIQINNVLMGAVPTFKATFYNLFGNESMTLRLNQCISSKLTIPSKFDDWSIQEFDISAFADASGVVGYLSTVE